MNTIISNIINQNNEVVSFLESNVIDSNNVDEKFQQFTTYLKKSNYNIVLANSYATFLQLLNKKENYSAFSLQEISLLFESLIKTQEYNLDAFVEAANYEYAVMNNVEKATEIIVLGIKKAELKKEELEILLLKIQKEKLK